MWVSIVMLVYQRVSPTEIVISLVSTSQGWRCCTDTWGSSGMGPMGMFHQQSGAGSKTAIRYQDIFLQWNQPTFLGVPFNLNMVVTKEINTWFMWVQQCHKPPMTGNGKHTTYLWWLEGWFTLWLCQNSYWKWP